VNKLLTSLILSTITLISLLLISQPSLASNLVKDANQGDSKPLRIAVSSNFSPVLTKLIPQFLNETGIQTEIISGSSGTLYQQILHGAPYDIFLSADDIHPKRLASGDFIVEGSLQTYALGQLAFWSAKSSIKPDQKFSDVLLAHLINSNAPTKIAIANPKIAPYGQRAFETLESLNLFGSFEHKFIVGINVSQTFQQVRSHAVTAGFVALSQLKINNLQGLIVPESLYSPIKQQLVILKTSKKVTQAKQLSNFLLNAKIQDNIAKFGYKAVKTNDSIDAISLRTSSLLNNEAESVL